MELLSCVWQAFCAEVVLAPFMQFWYWLSCDEKIRNPITAIPLNRQPTAPITLPAAAPRGRRVPARRDADMAVTESQRPSTATASATPATYTPRCRFPISIMVIRLSTESVKAAQARCWSAGEAGGSCGRGAGGRNGDCGGCGRSESLAISSSIVPHRLG